MTVLTALAATAGVILLLIALAATWIAIGTWWDRRHSPNPNYTPEPLPLADPAPLRHLNLAAIKERTT